MARFPVGPAACWLVPALVAALARDARACRIRGHERRGTDPAWPGYLVDSATAIARVHAIRVTGGTPEGARRWGGEDGEVTFAVDEWLRPGHGGRPDTLHVQGAAAADGDDYNPGPVPYRAVRPAGQRGSCYARRYRPRAEYLLLLRPDPDRPGALTPYWSPLAPVSEQVRGASDPWVTWVRDRAHVALGRARAGDV